MKNRRPAGGSRLDVGDLLGVIIAHDLGHLLLPPDSHSKGIMAPTLDPFLIAHRLLSFDPHDPSMIRARIGSMCRDEYR